MIQWRRCNRSLNSSVAKKSRIWQRTSVFTRQTSCKSSKLYKRYKHCVNASRNKSLSERVFKLSAERTRKRSISKQASSKKPHDASKPWRKISKCTAIASRKPRKSSSASTRSERHPWRKPSKSSRNSFSRQTIAPSAWSIQCMIPFSTCGTARLVRVSLGSILKRLARVSMSCNSCQAITRCANGLKRSVSRTGSRRSSRAFTRASHNQLARGPGSRSIRKTISLSTL